MECQVKMGERSVNFYKQSHIQTFINLYNLALADIWVHVYVYECLTAQKKSFKKHILLHKILTVIQWCNFWCLMVFDVDRLSKVIWLEETKIGMSG